MTDYSTNNTIVTHARVVAHLSQVVDGGVSENHWSIYLLLENETSIPCEYDRGGRRFRKARVHTL